MIGSIGKTIRNKAQYLSYTVHTVESDKHN